MSTGTFAQHHSSMTEAIREATTGLADFIETTFPKLSKDWWEQAVLGELSFQQQQIADERGHSRPQHLDFAALLRAIDRNWHRLREHLNLPSEGRNWLKELQTVRNKWAHMSAAPVPVSEIYRDADTLERVVSMFGCTRAAELASTTREAARDSSPAPQAAQPEPNPSSLAEQTPEAHRSHRFAIGDIVALRSNPDKQFPIIGIRPSADAETRYDVFDQRKVPYYESQLLAVEEPDQELLDAKAMRAALTALQVRSPSFATLASLHQGRINFVPYQYRPVIRLIRSDRPRLLIADEVGVGKTIETGLIIKELQARIDMSSILVLCPKALVTDQKWYREMKRFDEDFSTLDGRHLRHCIAETDLEGEWPRKHAKAIIPFSQLTNDIVFGSEGRGRSRIPSLMSLDPPPRFDLVVVDEAHAIRNSDTLTHQAVKFFCDNANAVIFLTATPVQMGNDDLFTLLNVLRPDLVIDRASFAQMSAPNSAIHRAAILCRAAKDDWRETVKAELERAADTEWGRLFIRTRPEFQDVYDRLGEDLDDIGRVRLIRDIEELSTFSHLINRTRRRDIGNFTSRKAETREVALTEEQRALHDDLLAITARMLRAKHGDANVRFMMSMIRRQAASSIFGLAPMLEDILARRWAALEEFSEMEETPPPLIEIQRDMQDLVQRAKNLDGKDPKADSFMASIRDKQARPNNKILVFSTFRHTIAYLERLLGREDLRIAVVHGDKSEDERSDSRRRFGLPREDPNAVDILLSSEIGSEGLDFQFCDMIANYDLPWNPMKVEQRIGRIDRYGQEAQTVAIVNMITADTVDSDIFHRCLMRIGVFEHAIGGGEAILGEISRDIRDIGEQFELTPEERKARLQQLSDNGIRRIQEEEKLEQVQEELFGLTPASRLDESEIEKLENSWLSQGALEHLIRQYLAFRSGKEHEFVLGRPPLKTLRVGQAERNLLLEDFRKLPKSADRVTRAWEKWLKGDDPALSVTFDQNTARDEVGAAHLTLGHPFVRQAAEALIPGDVMQAALKVRDTGLEAGAYPFMLYQWSHKGLRPSEILTPVVDDEAIHDVLVDLLIAAEDDDAPLPDQRVFDKLDARHHALWNAARANHIERTEQSVEHRRQSLRASHEARMATIGDQIARAGDPKILRMREGESRAAQADFERRMAELDKIGASGDIVASPVITGIISVES